MKSFVVVIALALTIQTITMAQAQTKTSAEGALPYYKIPDYPDTFTPGNVAARVVDGLGFRYYWATEGLRDEDLKFKPSAEARTSLETLQHIYGLTRVILNATLKTPTVSGPLPDMGYEELRRKTLDNIRQISEILKSNDNLDELKMTFKSDKGEREFPFWNVLNGPIDDCLWHVGQVVTFRRSSGNPINPKAEVLLGRLLD